MIAGAATITASGARAQQRSDTGTPPSVITNPPRQWGRDAAPNIYPDPDIIVIDPAFKRYLLGITAIRRVATGFKWAEGPAWSSEGQYLVFSDVQANIQYRYVWETGRVSRFRAPSYNSNGNSFDFQGRQLSTEDFNRRVVRWEHDGTMTVIADQFQGKGLCSPNDLVPHPDGSIWFTDPPYGDTLSEGHPDDAGGPTNPAGMLNPRIGAPDAGVIGGKKRELPNSVYRWDPSGRLDVVITEDQLPDPNGLCFSPDYKTLYVISTGKGPGDQGAGGGGNVFAFDVQDGKLNGHAPVHRHDGGRREVRPGWHARRCIRQPLDQLECAPGLCRRGRVHRRGQASWPHPPAGGVCQRGIRWAEAEHAVHVRQPVAVCASGADTGRRPRLAGVTASW